MTRRDIRVPLLLAALAVSGCGTSFELKQPSNFVVLDDHRGAYDFRAVDADGVVMAVREVDNNPRGTLYFWEKAVKNRLRTIGGYALAEEKDVHAAGGQRGRQLRFGRDQNGHPYVYWLTLFVTHDRVYVVEAGGRQDNFQPVQAKVERAIAQFHID